METLSWERNGEVDGRERRALFPLRIRFGIFDQRERYYRSEMKMDTCERFGSVRLYAEHICSNS